MNTPMRPSDMDSPKGAQTRSKKYGIRSTNVILENHFEPIDAIILIDNEKIFDVIINSEENAHQIQQINQEWEIENYGNLCIFPGIIDSNVHLHTNYDSEWDNTIYSTKLAAAGGVTTIIDNSIMSKPFENAQEYLEILKEKIASLQSHSKVDFGIFGLLEPKTHEHIKEQVDLGVMGLKCYLFSCLQNGIGNIEPEYLAPMMEYINDSFPDLLLAFHPEIGTERELYLSSPCRLSKLEDRLDMNFEIKSLGLGAGANKGAYLEEFSKSANSEGIDDDDDCPTPSLDTPSKLRSKIKKSREKTEINQLVRLELMSYGYEESKIDMENNSSDSDNEIPDSLNSSPMAKSNKGTPKHRDGKLDSAKPIRSSIFKNSEIKEVSSDENTPASGISGLSNGGHIVKSQFAAVRRSIFASAPANKDNENEPEHENEHGLEEIREDLSRSPPSKSRFNKDDDSDADEPKQDLSPLRRERVSLLSNKKNRSSSLVIAFSSKVSKLLEDDRQKELLTADNCDTAATKEPETVDDTNRHSGSSRNMFGSGLTADHKTESSASEVTDSTRKLLLPLSSDQTEKLENRALSPGKQFSPSRQMVFSPDFNNNSSQDANNTSFNSSPCESSDHISGRSNLLLRRMRKGSDNTVTTGNSLSKPSLSVPPRNFKIVNNLDTVKSPNFNNPGEHKLNVCYRVLLANRPTNCEENGVITILNAYKPDFKLRVMIQNLALASSFLKIRDKKKKEPHHEDTLFGDTGSAYLFFNERSVKKGETKYKATPAFRDKENRKLLVDNFRLGGIDLITSYHFYVPQRYKKVDGGNFRRAFSGFESIGFSLQALWTTLYVFYKKNNAKFQQDLMYKRKMIDDLLCKIAKVLCSNPAKMLKIDDRKGAIEKGKDADFVIWDPYPKINNQNLNSNHIFSRRILHGLVHKTYLRGKVIYDKENTLEAVEEQPAKFLTPNYNLHQSLVQ